MTISNCSECALVGFDPQFDLPAGDGPPAGRRFEHFYCPEWGCWVVIDRESGRLRRCDDQGQAAERAGMLEAVQRIVRAVADSLSVAARSN